MRDWIGLYRIVGNGGGCYDDEHVRGTDGDVHGRVGGMSDGRRADGDNR